MNFGGRKLTTGTFSFSSTVNFSIFVGSDSRLIRVPFFENELAYDEILGLQGGPLVSC